MSIPFWYAVGELAVPNLTAQESAAARAMRLCGATIIRSALGYRIAITDAPARVLVVTDRAFRELMQRYPALQRKILEAAAERLAVTHPLH